MELNDVTLRKDFNWEVFSSGEFIQIPKTQTAFETLADFEALFRLNLLIGISPILRQHIPIQIIACGGYVSLW